MLILPFVAPMPVLPAPVLRHPHIVVIGGGFAGASLALQLARHSAAAITVVEPREALGPGLAYSTPDPAHRLNVPSVGMSLDPDRPSDFHDWLMAQGLPLLPHDALASNGKIYAPRGLFGTYLTERMAELTDTGRITHRRARAAGIEGKPGAFRVGLTDGSVLEAAAVVLAITHPGPALPGPVKALQGNAALIADPYAPGALDAVGPDDRVMIVGTGLTSADVVASLQRRGHRGTITRISRRGHCSRAHGPAQEGSTADFTTVPATSALGLIRRIRATIAKDALLGLTWHACFDQLRQQGQAIWAALPGPERARLVRHVRVLWDTHRFRIAPQTADVLHAAEAEGRLTCRAAALIACAPTSTGARVTLRPRGTRQTEALDVDRVIVTTGPDHASVLQVNSALHGLIRAGMLCADPLGLGFDVTPGGAVRGIDGLAVPGLWVVGPLARGTVGELMGVPEVARFSRDVAHRIVAEIEATASARVTAPV